MIFKQFFSFLTQKLVPHILYKILFLKQPTDLFANKTIGISLINVNAIIWQHGMIAYVCHTYAQTGAYSIKLYGSVNYLFVIPAKFWP